MTTIVFDEVDVRQDTVDMVCPVCGGVITVYAADCNDMYYIVRMVADIQGGVSATDSAGRCKVCGVVI